MNVEFTNRFEKQLDKIQDEKVTKEIADIVRAVIKAASLREVKEVKKLKGYKTAFRIKVGRYRIGFIYTGGSTVIFSALAHRKDIYRQFP